MSGKNLGRDKLPLQARGHYGPYALALPTRPYADSFAPLKTTFMTPQSRISALVDQHYYGTGTLPEYTGVMLSLGGNTLDLVVCQDAVTAFVQGDKEGLYLFRVFERFALRDKDRTGRILLKYQEPERHPD